MCVCDLKSLLLHFVIVFMNIVQFLDLYIGLTLSTMVTFLSLIQGPIQAALRPAVWLPGIRNLHSYKERWVCPDSVAETCLDELIEAVERVKLLDPNITYQVNQTNKDHYKLQILSYTKAEWLDVVEIEFRPGRESGAEAKCYSFSSGFLPTWVPFGFIFNCMFFFVPFYDNKFNRRRLERLREAMDIECRIMSIDGSARLVDESK